MLKFFVPLRKRCDLNMKEILQVKMDLAFHFYPFTELGCKNSHLRSSRAGDRKLSTIHVL